MTLDEQLQEDLEYLQKAREHGSHSRIRTCERHVYSTLADMSLTKRYTKQVIREKVDSANLDWNEYILLEHNYIRKMMWESR